MLVIVGLSFWFPTYFQATPTDSKNDSVKLIPKGGQNVFPDDCDWEPLGRVIDGDTIKLKNGEKVRFIGINTPEVDSPYTKEQFFGPEASQKMHELLDTQDRVCLITDTIGNKKDKYDRILAYVYTESGENLNATMVEFGFARVYRKFKFDRKSVFLILEQKARSRGLGLWE